MIYAFLLMVAGVCFAFSAYSISQAYNWFILRLPLLVGTLMILGSFFFLPWVSFSLLQLPVEPDVLNLVFAKLGLKALSEMVELFAKFTLIPGHLLMVIMPSTGIFVRAVLALVAFTGIVGLSWFFLSLFARSQVAWQRIGGGLTAILSCVTALLLLGQLAVLDNLGTSGRFWPAYAAMVLGAHMEYGAWVAWVGLLLTSAGCILLMSKIEDDSVTSNYDAEVDI